MRTGAMCACQAALCACRAHVRSAVKHDRRGAQARARARIRSSSPPPPQFLPQLLCDSLNSRIPLSFFFSTKYFYRSSPLANRLLQEYVTQLWDENGKIKIGVNTVTKKKIIIIISSELRISVRNFVEFRSSRIIIPGVEPIGPITASSGGGATVF